MMHKRVSMTQRDFKLGMTASAATLAWLIKSRRAVPGVSGRLSIIPRTAWGAVPPDLNARAEHGLYDPISNPEGWFVYEAPLAQVLNTAGYVVPD